jgi:putative FmdB family regulatory protein
MPAYDYRCRECGEVFVDEHPMEYNGPVICPVCCTGRTQRIFLQCPATVLNWWNAAASSDAGDIDKRFRPSSRNKLSRLPEKRVAEIEALGGT